MSFNQMSSDSMSSNSDTEYDSDPSDPGDSLDTEGLSDSDTRASLDTQAGSCQEFFPHSDAASDELTGLDRFIAKEIRRRFVIEQPPAHLFTWTDPELEDEEGPRGEMRYAPGEGLVHLWKQGSEKVKQTHSQQMVQMFCEEFTSILKHEGRAGIVRFREALRRRLNDERDREKDLYNMTEYRNQVMKEISELSGSIDWTQEDIESPLDPPVFEIKRRNFFSDFYNLSICVTDRVLSEMDIDAEALPHKEAIIPGFPTTQDEVEAGLRRHFAPFERARRACDEVIALLEYRLHLLKQFMWGYDVTGTPPVLDLTAQFSVPDPIRNAGITRRRLNQAVTVVEMLSVYRDDPDEPDDQPPSHAEFKRYIEKETTGPDRGTSASAIIKGTKRLLEEGYHEPTAGAHLFQSIRRRQQDILQAAHTCGIISREADSDDSAS